MNQSGISTPWRALGIGFCLVAMVCAQSTLAGEGSAGLICVVNPLACAKSMVLAEAAPMVVVSPPSGPATFSVPMTWFITCPTDNNCGAPCSNSGVGLPLTPASITVEIYPEPPRPPGASLPPPAASATISTAAGTMAPPTCSSFGAFNTYTVPLTLPAGTPPGLYRVVGTATVTFPGGIVLSQSGDTVVCLVEPAPGRPGVPRLNLELLSSSIARKAPGETALAVYRITNNDPSNSVTLAAFGTSHQVAVRPQGGNEAQGVFTISNPFGADFPIQFNPTTNCILLPTRPYTQQELSNSVPNIPPGHTNLITVGIRSYGQCANGSCSESTLRIQGTFADGSPALAAAGMALIVDTSMASSSCARSVNDCNFNGIPDVLDISSRRSGDQNFNAIPDECEVAISVPIFSSVSPTNALAGAPLQVQVAFNETAPMANVWANGISLTRTQFFGAPLWVGTIPADTRPGPQTVYFLGQDARSALSFYLGLYQVRPLPRMTRIYIDRSGSVILEHNAAQTSRSFFVQENPDLSCSSCWTNRPSGPHPSPHDAGPAVGTRFFRLHD
jgi:hypothetical protein